MQTNQVERIEFVGGPLDGHVQIVSLQLDELNDVVPIPVNPNVIEKLSGHRPQAKDPATSIAIYIRDDGWANTAYHYLRSATPTQFRMTAWRG